MTLLTTTTGYTLDLTFPGQSGSYVERAAATTLGSDPLKEFAVVRAGATPDQISSGPPRVGDEDKVGDGPPVFALSSGSDGHLAREIVEAIPDEGRLPIRVLAVDARPFLWQRVSTSSGEATGSPSVRIATLPVSAPDAWALRVRRGAVWDGLQVEFSVPGHVWVELFVDDVAELVLTVPGTGDKLPIIRVAVVEGPWPDDDDRVETGSLEGAPALHAGLKTAIAAALHRQAFEEGKPMVLAAYALASDRRLTRADIERRVFAYLTLNSKRPPSRLPYTISTFHKKAVTTLSATDGRLDETYWENYDLPRDHGGVLLHHAFTVLGGRVRGRGSGFDLFHEVVRFLASKRVITHDEWHSQVEGAPS